MRLLCLQETQQETHLRAGEERWLHQMFEDEIYHVPYTSRSQGVMIGVAETLC